MQSPQDTIAELFGSETVQIQPIEIEIEEEYQQQIFPLYARLRSIERPTTNAVVEEAITSIDEADKLPYLCMKVETSEQFKCDVKEIKYETKVCIDGYEYTVASPKSEFLVDWKVRLTKYMTYIRTQSTRKLRTHTHTHTPTLTTIPATISSTHT